MEEDIFDEQGALTSAFLLARGYCCGNGCRNCPYVPRHGGQSARPPAAVERTLASGEVRAREEPT